MKLSVSNIAWDTAEDEAVLDLLARRGVAGIEVAPTKLWPGWSGATQGAAREARDDFRARGFAVPALQAILFDRPALSVFGTPQVQKQLLEHLDLVAGLATGLGARVLVFGSPKNRDPGERSPEQAFDDGLRFFRAAAEVCHKHDVVLCIEPNPAVYQCNFLTRWRDVKRMVETLDHPGIGLHLDTACIHLEGDSVVEAIHSCAGRIAHFHVTEPELGDLRNPVIDHPAIAQALGESGYAGWLSIEMRRSHEPLVSIDASVARVQEWYGD